MAGFFFTIEAVGNQDSGDTPTLGPLESGYEHSKDPIVKKKPATANILPCFGDMSVFPAASGSSKEDDWHLAPSQLMM